MKCKIVSNTTDIPSTKPIRLTRTSSATRASVIKSTSSSSHGNFKIKLKHGYSPSRSSSSGIHGCRTQTRSLTSSAASTSRVNKTHGNDSSTKTTNSTTTNTTTSTGSSKSGKGISAKCNCTCTNCGLSVDDNGSKSMNYRNNNDVSIVREPINLGTKNVRQILQCVHNGTAEIKDIILNECNIIYECRICLNLFRSLANLLSHKRFYCKDHKCETMLLYDNDYLTKLPRGEKEDDVFVNLNANVSTNQPKNINTNNTLRASHEKTLTSASTPPPLSSIITTKVKNRRKQETTFPGPVDSRDEATKKLSAKSPPPELKKITPLLKVSNDGYDMKMKRTTLGTVSKRAKLEYCVNKLLNDKSLSKLDQLTTSQTNNNNTNEIARVDSNPETTEEINRQPVVLQRLNINEAQISRTRKEENSELEFNAAKAESPKPDETKKEIETVEFVSTTPSNDINTTTSSSTCISQAIVNNIATNTPTATATSAVFNIDENANHPVASGENESNMQEIVSYPQSISSLVSDDADCSHMSENFPSRGDISEMDNESIDIDEEGITINAKEASSQQSLTSSSLPSSPSSSSLSSSTHREHSSNRNKPKTFDDTYETKPSPISSVPCSMCNSKFSSKKTLNVHIQTIHNVQRLIYPCPFCCLTFKQLFNATRHMIQVHRKGKTQVKFLREAVKRRAYPEVKSDENENEIVKLPSDGCGDELHEDDNPILFRQIIPPPPPLDNLGVEEEVEDEEDKSNSDNPFNLKAVPIVKVSKGGKRKGCDSIKDDSKLSSSPSSSSLACSSSTEIKLTINNNKQNNESEANQVVDNQSKSPPEMDKKDGTANQEKVRRVNPIIFSCINNCGSYFIKVDSKNQHEKKCSKSDDDNDDGNDNDNDNSTNQLESNCDLIDSSNQSHHHHHHHHQRHHRSRDGLDLNLITEPISKELEKVGNLVTRRCFHCPDLQFKTKSHFLQHLIVHIGYEVLKCKKCAYQTLDRNEMETHLGAAHGTPVILRGSQIVNLSTDINNEKNGSSVKKTSSSRVDGKEDDSESSKGTSDKTKGSSEKSNSSGIVLHLRPKLSRSRKKKKIYEIVGD